LIIDIILYGEINFYFFSIESVFFIYFIENCYPFPPEKFFNEAFSELSTNKKKEFLRIFIKEIIFEGFENGGSQENGNGNGGKNGNRKITKGQIKMGLWDLPPIGPLTQASTQSSVMPLLAA